MKEGLELCQSILSAPPMVDSGRAKVVVLLTDGEFMTEDPTTFTTAKKDAGTTIFTVGLGSETDKGFL